MVVVVGGQQQEGYRERERLRETDRGTEGRKGRGTEGQIEPFLAQRYLCLSSSCNVSLCICVLMRVYASMFFNLSFRLSVGLSLLPLIGFCHYPLNGANAPAPRGRAS